MSSTQALDSRFEGTCLDTGTLQQIGFLTASFEHRKQYRLRRDERIAALLSRAIRQIEQASQTLRKIYLARRMTHLRQVRQGRLDGAVELIKATAGLPEEAACGTFTLAQQCCKQVQTGQFRMVAANRDGLCIPERALQAARHFVHSHGFVPNSFVLIRKCGRRGPLSSRARGHRPHCRLPVTSWP